MKRLLSARWPVLLFAAAVAQAQNAAVVVRAGHFPNLTHAQAMVGRAQGTFEKALGDAARIEWKMFNTGAPAVEAIFADRLDLAYIGPSPAITGYVRSEGRALRIVAGAASGGAALIVRRDAGIRKPADFRGKKVASPQIGNSQDVSLRGWLRAHGLTPAERGGDVLILPLANADQYSLFQRKQIDAAWSPEPWASRLIREAGGELFLDERELWPGGKFVMTHLVVRRDFLAQHPAVVKKWIRAHLDLTEWITSHLPETKRIVNEELKRATTKALPPQILDDAFARMEFTIDPLEASLLTTAKWAHQEGYLGRGAMPDLKGIYDLRLLNEVLKEMGAQPLPRATR